MKYVAWLLAFIKTVLICGAAFGAEPNELDAWLQQQAADKRADIWMDSPSDWKCPNCPKVIKGFDGSKRFRLEVHSKTGLKSAPVLHWSDRSGKVFSRVGFTTMADFEKEYDRTVNGKQAAKVSVKRGLFYSKSPGRWTWPGDLRVHLQQPPHSLSQIVVSVMDDSTCIKYHNEWHRIYGER